MIRNVHIMEGNIITRRHKCSSGALFEFTSSKGKETNRPNITPMLNRALNKEQVFLV